MLCSRLLLEDFFVQENLGKTAPFSVHVWAIVGEGNSGKSISIGYLISLLGRGRADMRHVLLRGNGFLLLHVRKQSLQEANRTPQEVVNEIISRGRKLQKDAHLKNMGRLNVLLAIRSDRINEFPAGDDYISYFNDVGWKMESIVLMDYDHTKHAKYHSFGVPTYELYNSSQFVRKQVHHGWMVGQIRNHFGWA